MVKDGWDYFDTTDTEYAGSIYLSAFYFTYTTMSSVGYGDIHANNDLERIFCICLEMVGGFVYALIIASLTSIVTGMDTNQRALTEKLQAVSSYVRIRRFPVVLGRRVRRYFRHFYSNKTAIDEGEILRQLSNTLRVEVRQGFTLVLGISLTCGSLLRVGCVSMLRQRPGGDVPAARSHGQCDTLQAHDPHTVGTPPASPPSHEIRDQGNRLHPRYLPSSWGRHPSYPFILRPFRPRLMTAGGTHGALLQGKCARKCLW